MITPAEVRVGAAIWAAVRPWRRAHAAIRRIRNRLRARAGKPALPSLDQQETNVNDDQISSLGRGAIKWVGGAIAAAAVTHGLIDSADASGLATALELVGAGVVSLVGFVLSHRKHADAPAK